MAPPNPSLSWIQAFPILPLLALNTMSQPVGRVLGVSAFHSVWLRASPIICALDALGFTFRFLTYCALLHAAPREVMLIIGMNRFDKAETEHGHRKTTITATMLRLFGFFLGILPPAYMVGVWGDMRGTVAWACMYAGSYLVLEIASHLVKKELSKLHYAPVDFELDEIVDEPDGDEMSQTDSTEDTTVEENDRVDLSKDEIHDTPEGKKSSGYGLGLTIIEVGSIHNG